MKKFILHNPTILHFGQGVIEDLAKSASKYGQKAIIIYGQGSVKKHGYLDAVINELSKAGISHVEYSGIKSNPVIDDVYKAVEVCKKENIDFIIALGGGSVIDSSKITSLAYASDIDPKDMVLYKAEPTKKVPLLAILTLAATGTEMNPFAVIQLNDKKKKLGFYSPLAYPDESFLDPTLTLTVPADYTAYGIVDLIAHAFEAYFAAGDDNSLNDKFVAAVVREAMEYGPLLVDDLNNLRLREKIMWAATNALNGLLFYGRETDGDWGVHNFAHNISLVFDTPHGATLSIIYPAWMKHFKHRLKYRLELLGYLLFNESLSADQTIEKIEAFFSSLGAPVRMKDIGITSQGDKELLLDQLKYDSPQGFNIEMNNEDYEQILDLAWG